MQRGAEKDGNFIVKIDEEFYDAIIF